MTQRRLFTCPLCRLPIRQRAAYTHWAGERYHPECYADVHLKAGAKTSERRHWKQWRALC